MRLNSGIGTGMFQIGSANDAGQLAIANLNLDRSGNVGIGTTSPTQKLSVHGTSALPATSGTTQTGILRVTANTGPTLTATLDMGSYNTTGAGWIQATDINNLSSNFSLLLNPNGGNIGMGTTTPRAKLDVAGTNNATVPLFQLSSVSAFATTTQLIVTNSGLVGIGTSTPAAKVEIYQNVFGPALAVDGGLTGGDVVRLFRGQAGGLAGSASLGMALNVSNSNPQFSFRSSISSQAAGTDLGVIFFDSGKTGISIATSSVATGSTGLEPFFIKTTTSSIGLGGTTTPWATVSVNGSYQPAGTPTFAIGSSTKTDLFVQQSGIIQIATTTTLLTSLLNLGVNPSTTNGTTTVHMGKMQFEGYNTDGAIVCTYMVGTTWVTKQTTCTN